MKVLHLVLKRKWYDMIASGEKIEEYREIKPYWSIDCSKALLTFAFTLDIPINLCFLLLKK